jgi:hypothetical protein
VKTIWKFQLTEGILQKIPLPRGAEILHVGRQPLYPDLPGDGFGQLMLWAMVDSLAVVDEVRIWVVATGESLPEDFDWSYLGTALMPSGLVWHVFREP